MAISNVLIDLAFTRIISQLFIMTCIIVLNLFVKRCMDDSNKLMFFHTSKKH